MTLFSNQKNAWLLCPCFILAILLLTSGQCFAQVGSNQTVEISGYSVNRTQATMTPFAYGVLVSQCFKDTEFPPAPYAATPVSCDPEGLSVLYYLQIEDILSFAQDIVVSTGAEHYTVNDGINTDFFLFLPPQTSGALTASLNDVHTNKMVMEDDGPTPPFDEGRGEGKLVWDISEGIQAQDCQANDVVVISTAKDLTVVKSTRKFDTRIAGVISEEPKIYMGPAKDKTPLALAGITRCNVTAENGAIKKGDLLVSSSVPGHAMRADIEEIKPGMVVGSALGELEQGQGKIYILVNQ